MNDPIRLLIVEDERVVALDLRQHLQALGYQVDKVIASGEQAVAEAATLRPDLILMDIHLEGRMDGIAAAAAIESSYRVPIVFLTAYAEDETLRRAIGSRPFGYLVKPCDGRELHATIQTALARREVEIMVEQSEARLKLAMEVAELGVIEWDPVSNLLRAEGMLGIFSGPSEVPIEEDIGVFLGRVHGDDKQHVLSVLRQTLNRPETATTQFRAAHADGPVHFLEAHAKAYPGTGNHPPRVIGVLRDVTERRLTEEHRRLSSVVFDTTAEALLICDASHRIIAINAAFTSITGYGTDEAVGANPGHLLDADLESANLVARIESSGGSEWRGEVQCQRRDGERFPTWLSLSIVRDEGGGVSHYVLAFSDISAVHDAEQRLHHLATHDTLTDLPNRLLFEDRCDHAIEQARRTRQCCLLLFIDLDEFKVINDSLGHSIGDQLLQVVTQRFGRVIRRSDTLARLGGDEFVIVAGFSRPEDGASLAEKLLASLKEPIVLGRDNVTVTCSIGISVFPDHGDDRHVLMRAADVAMYSAKTRGRNGYAFYTQEMSDRAATRMRLEQGLREAIVNGQLAMHYQPQVNIENGALIGVEALIRWRHPVHGVISPETSIAIAEDSGVIHELGTWVLRRSCGEILGLLDPDGDQLRLAINVSARQFARPSFVDSLREVLRDTAFPGNSLELEITESCLQDTVNSLHNLRALKEIGIKISIDDFGTGYSSLSVLHELPIDQLKIDRSFVCDINTDRDSSSVVMAICTMAQALRMDVIAEGVEHAEQAQTLLRLDCRKAQGYFYSEPLGYDRLVALLDAQRRGPRRG